MRCVILLLAASVALGTGSVSAQVGKNKNLWNWTSKGKHHGCVVKVTTIAEAGYKQLGTGVLIHVDTARPNSTLRLGYVLTASHVVAQDKGRGTIELIFGNGFVSRGNKVSVSNKEFDIGVVPVWIPNGILPAKLATNGAIAGDKLEFAGLGGELRISELRHFGGTASLTTNRKLVYADVALLAGDSGGPVFNDRREVVGIISGGWQWFDKGLRNKRGHPLPITWPARACNTAEIRRILQKATGQSLLVGTPTSARSR